MKEAHRQAIAYAKKQGAIISFDPNIRIPLWKDTKALHDAIMEFLPYADIVKISDEELEFITGEKEMEQAKKHLFCGDVKLILYTKGENGAEAYTKDVMSVVSQRQVKAIDTTGAGDAFIGSFLYQLAKEEIRREDLSKLTKEQLQTFLKFSNTYCRESVKRHGAIASYPAAEEMELLQKRMESRQTTESVR